MTDRIIEYRDKWEESELGDSFEKPTREMACEWLDAQIEYHKELQKLKDKYVFPLAYGVLLPDKGEFENEIESTVTGTLDPVMYGTNPYLQIYQGIEKLAEIIGTDLHIHYCDKGYPYEYWFKYDKYIILEVKEHEIQGVKCTEKDFKRW